MWSAVLTRALRLLPPSEHQKEISAPVCSSSWFSPCFVCPCDTLTFEWDWTWPCSFYSTWLLGNTSIRMDRAASTALTSTSTASCLLFSPVSQLIKEAKRKKELFHSPVAVRLCCQRARWEGVMGGQHAKLQARKAGRRGQCCPYVSLCSHCASPVWPGTCCASPGTAQGHDNLLGGNQEKKCWDWTTAPWRALQRNSARFQTAPLVLAQPSPCWASLCFWKPARIH